MSRTLTPERHSLILEAKQLREFGFTQQRIAETLRVPRTTILRWLKDNGLASLPIVNNGGCNVHKDLSTLSTTITLYPTVYEKADGSITPESIDLILTDPPYLVSSKNISRTNQSDLQRDFGDWDKTEAGEYKRSVSVWASLMAKHLKVGGSLYLFMGHKHLNTWAMAFQENGLTDNGLLVWHRTNPAPQIRKTRWCPAFDLIMFYSKGSPKTFRWIGQNEMHSVITGGICGGDERSYHPTQKPRWILEKLLWVSSQPGDIVLDPFAGSGSTAFAARRLPGRSIILVEPEPEYTGLIQGIAKREFRCPINIKQA